MLFYLEGAGDSRGISTTLKNQRTLSFRKPESMLPFTPSRFASRSRDAPPRNPLPRSQNSDQNTLPADSGGEAGRPRGDVIEITSDFRRNWMKRASPRV